MTILVAFGCLAYIGFLMAEKISVEKARKKIPHIIHVNGIRGKSSVSRLIDAGLRAGGFSVFTKTTGTSPTMIFTDGTEHLLRRRGGPSIKEQLSILKQAAKQNAEILVIECMAVRPEYQKISEEQMLKSTVGVITNVRLDHLDEMGDTVEDIAVSLSNSIPVKGILFTGEKACGQILEEKATEKNTETVYAEPIENWEEGISDSFKYDFKENISIALSVCRHFGVPQEAALAAMAHYKRDPGAFKVEKARGINGAKIKLLNAMAANDPTSTEKILDFAEAGGHFSGGKRVLLINNRRDRPDRMKQFIDFASENEYRFEEIFLIGSCGKLTKRELMNRGISAGRIKLLRKLSDIYRQEGDLTVFATGNIVGTGKEKWGNPQGAGEAFVG